MPGYDINSKKWIKYRLRYLNVDGSKKFKMPEATYNMLMSDPKKFKSFCNGVGSKVGFWGKLTYHFIPNTIWFMSITQASDIHDVGYSIPDEFDTIEKAIAYKHQQDSYFYDNICIEATRRGGWFEDARKRGAWVEYLAVKSLGSSSFLANKIILNNLTAV